jgi:hypothetical protein
LQGVQQFAHDLIAQGVPGLRAVETNQDDAIMTFDQCVHGDLFEKWLKG